jgi:hypothetical protein
MLGVHTLLLPQQSLHTHHTLTHAVTTLSSLSQHSTLTTVNMLTSAYLVLHQQCSVIIFKLAHHIHRASQVCVGPSLCQPSKLAIQSRVWTAASAPPSNTAYSAQYAWHGILSAAFSAQHAQCSITSSTWCHKSQSNVATCLCYAACLAQHTWRSVLGTACSARHTWHGILILGAHAAAATLRL